MFDNGHYLGILLVAGTARLIAQKWEKRRGMVWKTDPGAWKGSHLNGYPFGL
jgi:hypothetical protein